MEWGSSPEREERDTEKVTTGFCSLKRMEEKRKVGMKEGKAGERKEGRKTRKKEREREAELGKTGLTSEAVSRGNPQGQAETSSPTACTQNGHCLFPTESGEMAVPLQRSHGQEGGGCCGRAPPCPPGFTLGAPGADAAGAEGPGPGEASGVPASRLVAGEARKTAGSLLSVGLPSRPPGMSGTAAAPRGLELLEVHPPCWLSAAMEDLTPWTMNGTLQSWMDRIAYSHTSTTGGSPRVPSGGPHPGPSSTPFLLLTLLLLSSS